MRTTKVFLGAVALLASFAIGSVAAEDDYRYLVRMDHQVFIPEAGDFSSGIEHLAANTDLGMVHVFVQMESVPATDVRGTLAESGIVLQGYIPENAYYALVSTELTESDLSALGVRWMAPIGYEAKISARIREGRFEEWSQYEGDKKVVAVQFHRDVTEIDGARMLESAGGILGSWIHSTNTRVVALSIEEIDRLAESDVVKFVAHLSPPMSNLNDSNRGAIGVDLVHQAPYGLDGTNSHVLVYDGGLMDIWHNDFGGRAIEGESGGVASHATHVGGTVGGNGQESGGQFMGMAPNTWITSYEYESCSPYCLYDNPQDIEANYAEGMFTFGTQFATNSIGSNIDPNGYNCDWEGDYEMTAQLVDAIAGGSLGKPFLSVWANGNERAYSRCGQSYESTGIPATSKNGISVGATNSNDHSMTWFSSWGPVDDGRLRPDICAPGCQSNGDGGVTSTDPGNDYSVKCGTSMSTPTVSGVIALIRQQGRMSFGFPVDPRPATIKALLVNTSHDYGNTGPDFQFGYGEIRATAAVDHIRDYDFLRESRLSQGERKTFELEVESVDELRATLAWDDIPGEYLAAKALVNDLDATLESPSGAIHQAWVLNPASPGNAATRGSDRLNPLEQVLVDNPEDGVWKLHIDGFLVPEGPQTFSVVANAPVAAPTTDVPEEELASSGISDLANYPNPFMPRTTIRFRTQSSSPIDVEVFDASGRLVRTLLSDATRPAGTQFVTWDGTSDEGEMVAGGVYFYQVSTDGASQSKKMIVMQ